MDTKHIQIKIPLSFEQVIEIVRQLSPPEKQHLSKVLWTEQTIDEIEIPGEQKQMVRERIEKDKNNSESYLTWDDIESKIAARN